MHQRSWTFTRMTFVEYDECVQCTHANYFILTRHKLTTASKLLINPAER